VEEWKVKGGSLSQPALRNRAGIVSAEGFGSRLACFITPADFGQKLPRFQNLSFLQELKFSTSQVEAKPGKFDRFGTTFGKILEFGLFHNSMLRGGAAS
jgi:hypothetical protein